ncbi:LeuA family protein [Lutispora saccharofermentans]|uniref:Pyruvate carboxyltransferase n=1 Tax=Lutispora saccharofermentans TaxID=3024236 RepID=A0ABT1NHM1_9FIRM|nr:pyruvate carboxyltransferase [Lutispora saccharofermentans]MCQ1530768.1 pyruvate carboxyltransferase [Lutispora saccharofermentans]
MEKYISDKWYTSSWNFLDIVRENLKFKDKIKIHDVTLRDGEQQAGLVMTAEQKIRLAEKMAEVGIHRIEAGMPAVSKQDSDAIKEIVKRNLGPEIFGFARCMVEDVKRAADCGVKGIVIEIPSNEQMIREAYGWTLDKAVDLSIKATQAAHEAGLYTVFFPIDMTRANIDWVLSLVEKVAADGYMDALAIVDTMGGLAPHTVPFLVDIVKERIKKPIELHFHDDFGLGSANSIMGLAAGADVVHTTISAAGERAGNASYEDIAMALLTMYDVNIGLNYSQIYPLSKLFRSMVNFPVRANRGIIGENIFKIESGIVAGWYENVKNTNPLLVSPYLPELVGHDPTEIVLGKHSGSPSIDHWLEKYHVSLNEEQKNELLNKIKLKAYQKCGLLDENDFSGLLKEYL